MQIDWDRTICKVLLLELNHGSLNVINIFGKNRRLGEHSNLTSHDNRGGRGAGLL